LLYGSNLAKSNSSQQLIFNSTLDSSVNFQALSFYESSFHFFTHRLKFFNTLSSNTITTSVSLVNNVEKAENLDTVRLLKPLVHELLLKQKAGMGFQTSPVDPSADN
jgi:hypothetical protein